MTSPRKALGKSVRFKVFNRDGFTCQYCGQQPPKVVLEVDHIVPVSSGGRDHLENLTTACFDCNRGKGAHGLETPAPIDANHRLELIREKELQLRELKKAMKKVEARIDSEVESINSIFQGAYPGYTLSKSFMAGSLRRFLELMPSHEVEKAMTIACSRISDYKKTPVYFCGICWKLIKGDKR